MSEMNTSTIVKKEIESDVPLEPQTVVPLQSRDATSTSIEAPVIIRLDPTSFNLPNDWVIEQRFRSSPKYAKRYDKVFPI